MQENKDSTQNINYSAEIHLLKLKIEELNKQLLEKTSRENALLASLEEAEKRISFVVDNIRDIIFQTDKYGNLTYLNPVWDAITGYSFKDSIGKNILDLAYPDDKIQLKKLFNDLLQKEITTLCKEYRLETRHRGVVWVEIQMQLIFSPEGMLTGTAGTISDINVRMKNFTELQYRVMFERIIMDISTELMNLKPEEIDLKIFSAFKLLGEVTGFDNINISLLSQDFLTIEIICEWSITNQFPENVKVKIFTEAFPFIFQRLNEFETIYYKSAKDIPPRLKTEIEIFNKTGVNSILIVPIIFNRTLAGFFGFYSFSEIVMLEEERISLIKTAGEMIFSAIKRMQLEKL